MLLLNNSSSCVCGCQWGWEQSIICLCSAFVSLVGWSTFANSQIICSISYGLPATILPQAMPQSRLDIFWICHGKMFQKAACVWFISVTHLLVCGLFQFCWDDISPNSVANDLEAFVNLHYVIMYDLRCNMLGFITWPKKKKEMGHKSRISIYVFQNVSGGFSN